MSDMMQRMGLRKEKGSFPQALFYFMRELHKYPLDQRYIVKIRWEKWFWKIKKPYVEVIKKGISIPLFNALLKEMNEHSKREEAASKRKK